ncbi:B- and T-lymphocyte attenuator-like [Carassius carassius]|uniref:B- and T-lymphocyte attenuator-like n=1 Tax=Carassius carassius TaxID=217509 RepID=UPI0028686BCF|nr:B- and T-lymphocyte attenuator-like [Carassius carassius]
MKGKIKKVQEKKKQAKMIICYLAVSLLLLSLSVSGTRNGSEMNCRSLIRVPRNTVFLAPVMSVLKINCSVTLHGCQRKPRVSWCKLFGDDCKALNYSNYIRTEWKNITEQEWMAFLVFLNISMEDTGFYRCKEGDMSIGHTINVTVTDNKVDKVSRNQSNTSNLGPTDDLEWLWSFVYICSGIAGLVVTVIIVTLLIIRCQERKSTRFKNKYMETHISDLPPLPHPNTRSPSDQLISASYRGCETPTIRGSSLTGRVSDGRHKTVGTERGEEENALVYASLNHQATSRGPKRTAQYEPEPSEYAAIRFQ